MVREPPRTPNPKRVAAGRRNVLKRKGLSPQGLERLRAAALVNQPWRHSTGPRTAEGKAKAAANGKVTQKREKSVRERRAELAGLMALTREMAAARRSLANCRSGSLVTG